MRTRRGILIAVTLVLLTAGSVAAATVMLLARMPDPDSCDRHGLGRWLVTADISRQSPDIQQRLLKRMLGELDEGVELSQVQSQLTAAQSKKLWQNVDFLCQIWFNEIVESYQRCPATQRVEVLDQLIARVEGWGIVDQLAARTSPPNTAVKPVAATSDSTQPAGKAPTTTMARLAVLKDARQKIEPWIEAAPEQRQPAMREFLSAVETRLLFRSLKNFRLFG